MSDPSGVPDLAWRLNYLFETRVGGDSKLWSMSSAANALTGRGVPVTREYLGQLRVGQKRNPSAHLLHGIAELFSVPSDFFFTADPMPFAGVPVDRVRAVMARSGGISDDGWSEVLDVLDRIRALERDDVDEQP